MSLQVSRQYNHDMYNVIVLKLKCKLNQLSIARSLTQSSSPNYSYRHNPKRHSHNQVYNAT